MSAKENPHDVRHERRRSSFLSSCFTGLPVYESDDLASTSLASNPGVKREEASRLSWSWSLKKKKKKAVAVDLSMESKAASQGNNDKLHKAKSKKPRSKPQVQQQEEQQLQVNVNSGSQTTTLPKISAKYDTRSRHAIQPLQTRTRTEHRGSSELKTLPGPDEKSDRYANLDPVVGLLILVLTLAIMLVFGRACAVACLCTCFYILPLLRTKMSTEGNSIARENSEVVDVESEEYKKKVVLEGLLERDGRRLSGLNSIKSLATGLR